MITYWLQYAVTVTNMKDVERCMIRPTKPCLRRPVRQAMTTIPAAFD